MNKQRDAYKNGFITFINDKIVKIGHMEHFIQEKEDFVLDGQRAIVMPGMINLHTHLGMMPFRGLQDDCKDRFRKYLLPMEKEGMTANLVYASSKYAMAEMLLDGTTTVMDMYYFEKEAAKAAHEMSIRAFLGETIIEEDACDVSSSKESLQYTKELLEMYKNHSLITPCVAPHATYSCKEDTLKSACVLASAYQVPLTMHVAEMDYEMEYFQQEYKKTPVEFLEELNVLNEHMIAVHCIHVTEKDIEILRRHDVGVAHCIGANTKAAKGVAPLRAMLEHKLRVGLGTDGASSGNTLDMITQLKLCANFHKYATHDRSAFPAEDLIALATIDAAKVLHMEDKIGSLEEGKQADITMIETDSVNMFPIYDPYSAIVYSSNAANVDTVFVAGKMLVHNKELVNCSYSNIKENLEKQMKNSIFAREL